MSNHSEEYLELVAETKTLTKELTELSNKLLKGGLGYE